MKVNRVLSLDDRKQIEKLLCTGMSHVKICSTVGIHKTTLYREFKRCKDVYNAEEAQETVYQSKNLIDWEIIGKRFGLLVVESYANKYKKRTWWKCKCDYGRWCVVSRKKLADYCSVKRPFSCGCIAKQSAGPNEKLPIEESSLRKFQDLIKFRKMNRDCWEWTGYYQKGKCPKTSWRNKAMGVRKCMYLLMNGTTYEPNPVFTTCGNLRCFNPDHLTLQRPDKRQYFDENPHEPIQEEIQESQEAESEKG